MGHDFQSSSQSARILAQSARSLAQSARSLAVVVKELLEAAAAVKKLTNRGIAPPTPLSLPNNRPANGRG